jgi:hypothetical protein
MRLSEEAEMLKGQCRLTWLFGGCLKSGALGAGQG